ncbi:MAG: hypothetical protein EOO38_18865 [Cytophagaceae bacterium]|nr:MAG: hypothetical protein EOO38_18865 [Cytophagaceae bacterium]
MAEQNLNDDRFLDCISNIYNAIAAIKAAAIERDSDVVLALQHAAEALISPASSALGKPASSIEQSEAFTRIGCLADLIDAVNLEIDDQLLHAASVLLHVASGQLCTPEPA